ncbi:MAG: type I 3-dehydroquinate dehydratase [Candidatus Thermoplasmatota archaeon]|nr:type I 3-dehydroquinate dehydratase [Candidatus Thermoplasmatota archaeon]
MKHPMVCITLRGETAEQMCRDAQSAKDLDADLVEVRIDKLWLREERVPIENEKGDNPVEGSGFSVTQNFLGFEEVDIKTDLEAISASTDIPMIFTCRPTDQGGFFPGDEGQRAGVLKEAIALKPQWIDLEVDIDPGIREEIKSTIGQQTKIIASIHSTEKTPTPSEIVQDVIDNQELGDVVKACYITKNRTDGLRIFEAAWELKDSDCDSTVMGLGPGGDWSRIHAPLLGQFMVYSTTESGWHLAQQGRINASDLKTAWGLLEYA